MSLEDLLLLLLWVNRSPLSSLILPSLLWFTPARFNFLTLKFDYHNLWKLYSNLTITIFNPSTHTLDNSLTQNYAYNPFSHTKAHIHFMRYPSTITILLHIQQDNCIYKYSNYSQWHSLIKSRIWIIQLTQVHCLSANAYLPNLNLLASVIPTPIALYETRLDI